MGPVLGGVALGVLEDGVYMCRKIRTPPKPAARSGEGVYMQTVNGYSREQAQGYLIACGNT